jgi:glycosyltransferase involved in cell wall biosynthesis
MRQADVFLLTSEFEGLPNSLIEAQALGIPAVSTDCPTGPAEIIERGTTGVLVPVGNAAAIADAILDMLSDAPSRRRMAAAARVRARSLFDYRAIIDQWQVRLAEMIDRYGDAR